MDQLQQTVEALRKNGFDADAFATRDDCVKELLRKLPKDETIAFGGSMTLKELGLYELLKENGYDVKWHWVDKEDRLLHNVRDRNIYLTGTNAVTEDGKLVNMDGNGNRVASMIFGHDDVYILSGANKIVKDVDAARERISNVASPQNAKRLGLHTPCAATGKCTDCDSPERICKVETVLHKKPGMTNVHVMLIQESLGY